MTDTFSACAGYAETVPYKSLERVRANRQRKLADISCVDCGLVAKRLPKDYANGLVPRCIPCARIENQRLRAAGIAGSVKVACTVCQKEVKRARSYMFRAKTTTCSKQCRQVMWNRRPRGPDHPQWKGNVGVYYGADWRRQSAAARVRDGNACRECGITRANYGREFDVHHIVRFLNFATSAEANVLSNLITLCRTCHRRADVAQHREVKAAGGELNGQRRSRRRTYPLFARMADVVCLFTRHWDVTKECVAKAHEMIEGECVGGLISSLYAINYPTSSVRRTRGLSVTPDRAQIVSHARLVSEISTDCWRFTLDGCDTPDPGGWAALLASGDHKRIVAAERTHFLDWMNVDDADYLVTTAGRTGNLRATKRTWVTDVE